ncbi:hypothetical protein Dimus_025271 [Dionaea muscipula]
MGVALDAECVFCHAHAESADYLLFECVFSQAVLRRVLSDIHLPLPQSNWRQWMLRVTKGKTPLARARRKCLVAAVYYLWNEWNYRVFHISAKSPSEDASGYGTCSVLLGLLSAMEF